VSARAVTPSDAVTAPPTAPEVRARLKLSFDAVDDVDLREVVDGETANQAALCLTDPYTHDLRLAVYRRCARTLAARGVPLGVVDSEFGAVPMTSDGEIRRLEGPHLRMAF
jgi:hypothetical protein